MVTIVIQFGNHGNGKIIIENALHSLSDLNSVIHNRRMTICQKELPAFGIRADHNGKLWSFDGLLSKVMFENKCNKSNLDF